MSHDLPQEIRLPKILVVYADPGETQRYRCAHLQQQLNLYGIPCHVREFRAMPLSIAQGYELVVFHRIPLDGYIRSLAERIHARGGITVFDTDDLIFDVSVLDWVRGLSDEDAITRTLYQTNVHGYRKTLELAHVTLVSTDLLARRVSTFGKPVWVHRNAFSLEMLSLSQHACGQPKQDSSKIVIGYASGTPTHDRDFEQVHLALQQVLRNYPETELWIIGHLALGDDWGTLNDRIRYLPFVPWQRLPDLIAQFDINIAPLEIDNPFCQAKTEIKYIEAGLVRVPTVASKTNAFEFAIRSGENGFLVASHAEWVESLERLVEDAVLRQKMGERAYADVLERYHPVVRGRQLITTLNQIGEHIRGHSFWSEEAMAPANAPSLWSSCLTPSSERRPSVMRRALFALRYRGLRIFLMKAWVYLQHQRVRLLSYVSPTK